jgi:Effector-associated domain 7
MASYALIIGIDAYPPASGLQPLHAAVSDARRMAAWLIEQGWGPPEHIRLLCAPHDPTRGERPATRAAIRDALLELQHVGSQAEPSDRLCLFYAGHGLGYSNRQLLLPQDTQAGAYSDSALPWAELELWLRTTGFGTQFCFLDTCRNEDANLSDVFIDARLPFDRPIQSATPTDAGQYVFYATGHGRPAFETATAGVFSQALRAGLSGTVAVSIDHERAERVVRFEALRAYLEREVPTRSAGRQRCVVGGQISGNPIMARLGPAARGELRVAIEPPGVAPVSTVEIYRDDPPTPVERRSGPPFHFDLLQDEIYTIVARAPGYVEAFGYSRVHPLPQIVQLRLRRPGDGTLSGRDRALAALLIAPGDPYLPVRLYNGNGDPVDLPPRRPHGYHLKAPPDRYRAVLATPERNIEQEFELHPGEKELTVTLPFTAPRTPLDRLLEALDNGQSLNLGPGPGQAALLILAEGMVHPVAAVPLRQGVLRPTTPAKLPNDIAELVQGCHLGTPGLAALHFPADGGQPHQLLLPLLAGRTTIVGIDGAGSRSPSIELLLAPRLLLRRHSATQKRIVWAQRFFKAEGRIYIPAILEGLDDEPLALALAGYAALSYQDAGQARKYALRLQAAAPDLDDGYILLTATERMLGRAFVDPDAPSRVPVVLSGLQSQMLAGGQALALASLALQLLSRAIFSQIWLLIRGQGDFVESESVDKTTLRDAVVQAFDLEELAGLCFDITQRMQSAGIDLSVDLDLIGGATKTIKVQNLILYLDRRGYLDYLVAAVRRARPGRI